MVAGLRGLDSFSSATSESPRGCFYLNSFGDKNWEHSLALMADFVTFADFFRGPDVLIFFVKDAVAVVLVSSAVFEFIWLFVMSFERLGECPRKLKLPLGLRLFVCGGTFRS